MIKDIVMIIADKFINGDRIIVRCHIIKDDIIGVVIKTIDKFITEY